MDRVAVLLIGRCLLDSGCTMSRRNSSILKRVLKVSVLQILFVIVCD